MAKSLIDEALRLEYIDFIQREKADKYKKETGMSEDTVIRDTKIMSDETLSKLYGDVYHLPLGKTEEIKDISLIQRLNVKELFRLSFLPERKNNEIIIYTANPASLLYAEDVIKEKVGFKGKFIHKVVSLNDLSRYISKVFDDDKNSVLDEFNIEDDGTLNSTVYDTSEIDSSAVVNLFNKIVSDAVNNKISDIHLELQQEDLIVRFRKDAILYEYYKTKAYVSRPLFNRIKTLSALDVNNNKCIQNGNCRLKISGKTVDFRISVIPALHGENIAIRVLDQGKVPLDIKEIGFSKENEEKFRKIIKRPQGMILVTGPTGSGKSTSLHSAVSELNTKERCIITFEDPVEYRIPGIVQVQINPAMNVTFPEALKCGLRQDIDIALVGEIRDNETATIALEASNTGHMVFSTLHANNAVSSISRLVELGAKPYMISRSLIAIINQRLVRRICEHCKEEYLLEKDSPYRKILGCGDHPMTLFRGKGCSECGGTGYNDVVALHEFLVVDKEIAELIEKGESDSKIEEAAIKKGMKNIYMDGIEKALQGITTLDEIHRAAFFNEL